MLAGAFQGVIFACFSSTIQGSGLPGTKKQPPTAIWTKPFQPTGRCYDRTTNDGTTNDRMTNDQTTNDQMTKGLNN